MTTCAEHSCTSGNSIKVTNSEGYLASLVTSTSGCGSDLCPWVLEALPGQRFNLTFRSFVRVQTDAKQQLGGRFCQRLATVFERSSQVSKDVTLCDNDASVVRIMTSAHEEVKLKLYYGTPENPAHFVVHYQGTSTIKTILTIRLLYFSYNTHDRPTFILPLLHSNIIGQLLFA